MLRALSACLIVTAFALIVWGVLTVYDTYMPAGRMWQTPRIMPYEEPIPVMMQGSVPLKGSEEFYRIAAADDLKPPFALTSPSAIAAGKTDYGYFCIHCHGKNFDGYGTVGQSFAPPPRDLCSQKVQSMPAGQLFKEISFGIPGGRQPALDTTMAVNDRWNVIAYVKSLGLRK